MFDCVAFKARRREGGSWSRRLVAQTKLLTIIALFTPSKSIMRNGNECISCGLLSMNNGKEWIECLIIIQVGEAPDMRSFTDFHSSAIQMKISLQQIKLFFFAPRAYFHVIFRFSILYTLAALQVNSLRALFSCVYCVKRWRMYIERRKAKRGKREKEIIMYTCFSRNSCRLYHHFSFGQRFLLVYAMKKESNLECTFVF